MTFISTCTCESVAEVGFVFGGGDGEVEGEGIEVLWIVVTAI